MAANNLEEVLSTSVKFYASLSKQEALSLVGNSDSSKNEPGALCFVSDDTGNYIILDGKIFGGGTGGGDVYSVNSKTGAVVLTLSDFPVVVKDGQTLKTLSDYFRNDGSVISNEFKVTSTYDDLNGNPITVDVVIINSEGITINGKKVLTEDDLMSVSEELIMQYANAAENNAKNYADSILTSVYKVKGTINTYSLLQEIESPKIGDVYNVVSAQGTIGTSEYIPAGTNYVYTENGWDALGGVLDLSNYKTADDTDVAISLGVQEAKSYTDSAINTYKLQVDNKNLD